MNLGITGNIGTGKSSVLNRLNQIGFEIYDLDFIARSTYKKGHPAYLEIVSVFNNILDHNDEIDTKKLSKIVFNSKSYLTILQNIVWPKVNIFILEILHSNKKNIVFEGAVLLEAQWHKLFDHVWIIDSEFDIVKKRLLEERNINEKMYLNILKNQQDRKQMESILKKDNVPYTVIANNLSINDLIKIVDKEINKII
jgi:dephospho-CoA kinase